MAGTRHILSTREWVDPDRVCALGGSYGGYMINWINGNAPHGFFKALVNHDGVFSFESSYFTTEELFFMEHEFGGVPWRSDGVPSPAGASDDAQPRVSAGGPFSRFSPHTKVDKWQTPTLVIHGGKDYRLTETEGLATFQALQRRGIPSEFLFFPTENHWVLNVMNS